MQEIGFAAYLSKPVKRSQLYNSLVTVIGSSSSATEERPESIVTRHSLVEGREGRIRILMAEDNVVNQKVALRILEKLGYRADAVANGREAVTTLESIPYDLVLMDVQMPEMDGFEATRVIRDPQSKVRNHQVPIIAMTAHAMKGDRERCLEAGMDDYVSKPINPKELLEAIQRQMSRDGKTEESTAPVSVSPDEVVFDRSALLERLGCDQAFCDELLDLFTQDTPDQIKRLRQALEADDYDLVERLAHTVRGSAANLGAETLSQVAGGIEEAVRKSELDEVSRLAEKLEGEFERFKTVVSSLPDTDA
jgi:CheY-like chemotaxis protein/HPt (histidine-containing phosphotransfer) domain-containing protein